jgi:hypothetical protein
MIEASAAILVLVSAGVFVAHALDAYFSNLARELRRPDACLNMEEAV